MDIVQTHKTLISFFYDLVKAVPAGTINNAIMNTVLAEDDGTPTEIDYCDQDLRKYAESCSRQLLEYRTKFTREQLDNMERFKTVACDNTCCTCQRPLDEYQRCANSGCELGPGAEDRSEDEDAG